MFGQMRDYCIKRTSLIVIERNGDRSLRYVCGRTFSKIELFVWLSNHRHVHLEHNGALDCSDAHAPVPRARRLARVCLSHLGHMYLFFTPIQSEPELGTSGLYY